MNDLNLENPIFVLYVSTKGLSRQRADNMIAELLTNFTYNNCTTWCIPTEETPTRIELIWKGFKHDTLTGKLTQENLETLNDKFNLIVDLLSNNVTNEVIKQRLRDISLTDLFK